MRKYVPNPDDTERLKLLKKIAQFNHDELIAMKSEGINVENERRLLKIQSVIGSLNRRIQRRKNNHSVEQLELYADNGTNAGSPTNQKSGGDYSGWSLLRKGWRQLRKMFVFGNGDKEKQEFHPCCIKNDDRKKSTVRQEKSAF